MNFRDDGFAEKLFASIIKENPDCPLAYSAIIQGMLKYGQVTKGVELFNYMRDKNVPLSLNVYNLILANVNNIVEGERWKFILVSYSVNSFSIILNVSSSGHTI